MGGIANAINDGIDPGAAFAHMTGMPSLTDRIANLEKRVERLTKLVHILWKEAEKVESVVKVIPEGLTIKTAFSEVTVLKNGSVIIKGLRILVQTPGKYEFYS